MTPFTSAPRTSRRGLAPVWVSRRRTVACALAVLLAAVPQAAAPQEEEVDQPRLAFTDGSTIYESTTAGQVREVTRTPERAPTKYSPTWSPDGSRLAYASASCARLGGCDAPGSFVVGFDIHVADVHTGQAELLLFEPHMAIVDVTWSPDGSQLAFTGYTVTETSVLLLGAWYVNVYAVDVASGQVTPVTVDGLSRSPVWSPDGSRLAYISLREGGSPHVYVAPPTVLGVPTRVSSAGGDAWMAEWSPDGRWIAYVAYKPIAERLLSDEEPEIWLARADGSGDEPTGEAGYWIDWAPDSRSLVLSRSVRSGSSWVSEVHVLPLGGTARYVTHGGVPRWSPDGRHLALHRWSNASPYQTLVILDLVDGGEATPYSANHGLAADHRWAPGAVVASTAVTRVSGADRFETAAAVSRVTFPPGVRVAFVATGLDFADALAGGPAAIAGGGPVLLTQQDRLPVATAREVQRLRPGRVVVLGGRGAVSDGVVEELRRRSGGPVERVAGANRFETAVAVSRATFSPGSPVHVATGLTFPDALAAGVAAGLAGGPVLVVPPDTLPGVVAEELRRLSPPRITILGGVSAVSLAVEEQLRRYAPEVVRVAGSTRYETAAAVSRAAFPSGGAVAYLVSGETHADALAAVPAAAADGGPVLLVGRDVLPGATSAELDRLGVERLAVIGGPGAVSDRVATEAGAHVRRR